jgi:galactokinase
VAELDTAVEAAVGAGALGARMTGGGFGGSAIALVRADAAQATIEAVQQAFADRGFRAPDCFVVTACGSAIRDA